MRHGSFVPHDVTCARTHSVSPLLTLKWLLLQLPSLTLTFFFSCMHIKFCDATVNNIYVLWCKHDWFDAVSVGKILGLKFKTPTTCCIVHIIYCRDKSCTSITWFFFPAILGVSSPTEPFFPHEFSSSTDILELLLIAFPVFLQLCLGANIILFFYWYLCCSLTVPSLNFLRNDMGRNSSFLYTWKLVFCPDIGLTV